MIGDASQSLVQGLREAVLPLPPNVPEEWLDDDCLKRFLRADGNDFEKARERLRGTLKWRDEVQPSQLRCAACAEVDPHSHYMQQVGYAFTGQPVIYSDIGLASDKSVKDNVDHCIQTLERAIEAMPPGVETYIWVSDFHGFGWSDMDPRMAAGCLQLFSHHYPERMGTFYMVEAPYIFSKLYKLLSPYIDPVTAGKLVFVKGPTGKGGGDDLRETLSKHFDDELVDWMVEEMTENREKKLKNAKSWNVAVQRGCGVFGKESTHDCRGPPSFIKSSSARKAWGVQSHC